MEENKKVTMLPQAIENLLETPTKSIGNTFSDIWYLIFGGFEFNAKKKKIKYILELEQYKKEIYSKISAIPKEKWGAGDLQIIGQILEASKFCVDKDEIRKMFVNLLASSIEEEKCEGVHPSYAQILKEISRDEALLLLYVYKNLEMESNRFPVVDIRHIISNDFDQRGVGTNIIKIVDSAQGKIQTVYTSIKDEDLRHILGNTYLSNQSNIGEKANCKNPEKISEYLLNLERQRIIDIRDRSIIGGNEYDNIINSKFLENRILSYKDEEFINENIFCFIKKYFCLTEYGKSFIQCCV